MILGVFMKNEEQYISSLFDDSEELRLPLDDKGLIKCIARGSYSISSEYDRPDLAKEVTDVSFQDIVYNDKVIYSHWGASLKFDSFVPDSDGMLLFVDVGSDCIDFASGCLKKVPADSVVDMCYLVTQEDSYGTNWIACEYFDRNSHYCSSTGKPDMIRRGLQDMMLDKLEAFKRVVDERVPMSEAGVSLQTIRRLAKEHMTREPDNFTLLYEVKNKLEDIECKCVDREAERAYDKMYEENLTLEGSGSPDSQDTRLSKGLFTSVFSRFRK